MRTALAMIVVISVVGLDVLIGGCSRTTANSRAAARTPAQLAAGWATLGANLPDDDEVRVFADRVPESLDVLRAAMRDPNGHVRICAGHVIERLGPRAAVLSADLRNSLSVEPESINQVYWVMALTARPVLENDSPGSATKSTGPIRSAWTSEVTTGISLSRPL